MMRLDRILSETGLYSRSEAQKAIRRGTVAVDGVIVKKPEAKTDENSEITINGSPLEKRRTVILMLNKPSGYVTSLSDGEGLSVMSLIEQKFALMGAVPVGRLDKDTEGLLLFTNNGTLLHKLISPKSNVNKRYYAEFEGQSSEATAKAFENGIILKDGTKCRPALFEDAGEGKCFVNVTEGQYHQVRRMLASQGLKVTYLRRDSFAGLTLAGLDKGMCRELTPEEASGLG